MKNRNLIDNDYPDHDTDWATSAKGNEWRRIEGKVLVIGYRRATGKYWAMCDGDFAEGSFSTEEQAKEAAERMFRENSRNPWGY
jgi:hypothetical protein